MIAQDGGVLSLDKIMVELYRRTREIPKRTTITSRLYRMAQKGMIYNVPGKKGIYSTYEMTEQDAKKMFGQFDGETEEAAATPAPATPAAPTPAASSGGLSQADKDRLKAKLMGSTSNYARR
jgi:hypothetical protein